MRTVFALAAVASLSIGCAATSADVDDEGDTEQAEGAASLSSTSTYYTARRDYRRCAYPMCGGWWVSRVNKSSTVCADGRSAAECYVSEIDWSAAGLDGSVQGDVLRGTISRTTLDGYGEIAVFKLSEAWQAQLSEVTPSGSFYKVTDLHRVCVRAPCFDTSADKLNTTTSRELSDLLGVYGAKAQDALATQQLIVAGDVSSTRNGGRGLSVTQFWTRISAKPADPLACNADSDCTISAYNKEVTGSQGCYCTMCPTTVMNTKTEDFYRTSWEKSCSNVRLMCPMVMCIQPPTVACVANQCVAVSMPSN